MSNKSYKMIIADDEFHIRDGLQCFEWDTLGFHITGSAANGKKALELMESDPADVILTDIKMPVMDGLELSRIVHDRFPSCKVIVLTGHKDFEYARAAIGAGVYDYLLKPVDLNELKKLSRQLKIQLDEERQTAEQMNVYRRQLAEALPAAAHSLFLGILEGRVDQDEIREKMDLLELGMNHRYYACIVFKLGTAKSFVEISLLENFAKLYNADIFTVKNKGQVILLWNFDLPAHYTSAHSYLLDSVRKLKQRLNSLKEGCPSGKMTAGIGNIYRNLPSLAKSYQEALKSLEGEFFNEEESIFYCWQDNRSIPPESFEYPYGIEEKLVGDIFNKNREDSLLHLTEFWDELENNRGFHNPVNIRNAVLQLFNVLERKTARMEHSLKDLLGTPPPFTDFVNRFSTLGELKREVAKAIKGVIDILPELDRDARTSCYLAVQTAKKYIMEHYHEKISLSQVAEHVHLNPSYFSVQFKKETGMNFVEFLSMYRTEKAKELLKRCDLKIYEVGIKVGYENQKYFTDTFKKYTDLTPKEYRNRYFPEK